MFLEILLAIMPKLNVLGIGFVMVGISGIIISYMAEDVADSPTGEKTCAVFRRRLYTLLPFAAILCILPTAQDVWKVRVTMLKYHLASPENMKRGIEHIERLARRVECRYLGCEEKK